LISARSKFSTETERGFRERWANDNKNWMRFGAVVGGIGTAIAHRYIEPEQVTQATLRLSVMAGAQITLLIVTFLPSFRQWLGTLAACALAVSTGGFLFVLAQTKAYDASDACIMTVLAMFGAVLLFRLRLRDTVLHCGLVLAIFLFAGEFGGSNSWNSVLTLFPLLFTILVCSMAAASSEALARKAYALQVDLTEQLQRGQQANDRLNVEIRERQNAEIELDLALAAAHGVGQAKSEFLTLMSHELRTPMNGIVNTLELLSDTETHTRQREFLSVLQASTDSLLDLLDDLLDLGQIERGALSVSPLPVDLLFHARKVLHPLRLLAQNKGLELHFETEVDELARLRMADPTRLGQILGNLVNNAIESTRAGEVTVSVTYGPKNIVCYRVKDTATGASKERHSYWLAPFGVLRKGVVEHHNGCGLGLSIASGLVKQLGGSVGADHMPSGGSSLWFKIPLPPTDDAPQQSDAAASVETTSLGLHVLLVEDDLINRRIATWLLDKLGCTYDTAGDGQQALAQMVDQTYDAVLMDCMMPRLNGWECTSRIRSSDQPWAGVPIIALTASAIKGGKERCLEAGMDFYLAKPIRLKHLSETLSKSQIQRA
jgi:signal transduction histidine kinase/ActR/RegA family two-component response regulator